MSDTSFEEALKNGGLTQKSIGLIVGNQELAIVVAAMAEIYCEKFGNMMEEIIEEESD